MAKFRFSFDVGAGWVVYAPHKNNITWIKEKITLAAIRVKLDGNITFAGSEYTALINFKDAGNSYVPIKVEQDNGSWNNVFEGVAFLLVPWDENRSTITLTNFTNDDEYDNFLSNYNIKYGYRTLSLTNHEIVYPSSVSITVDAVLVPGTGLTPANYILNYDINGRIIRSGVDPRWAYFLFRSTNPDGSHNFETMSFNYDPGSFDYVNIRLLVGGDSYNNIWVKLPPVVGATQALSDLVATATYRFPDLLNALIPLANTSLTFTEATAVTYTGQSDSTPTQYAWFDYTKYQLAEASDVANLDAKESSLTCKYLLDIMSECFDLHWYLDGTALKFKHTTELTTTGTLDLSAETAQLQRLDYIETDIPDIEVFQAKDSKGDWNDTGLGTFPFGKVQIYYRVSNNILSRSEIKEHPIPVLTNVQSLMSGNYVPENNEHCLIETLDDSSIPRVVYGINPYWNIRLSAGQLYGHLNKWRYGTEPALSTNLKFAIISLSETQPRPLTKLPIINYHEDLLTDYDFNKAIITSAGSGITQRIEQDLNGDNLKLLIHI